MADGGNTVPRITKAEHIGPTDTGDNIEAKRAANYVWNSGNSQWERMTQASGGSGGTVTQGSGASAGTAWRVQGDFAEQSSLTAGSLNADLVPSTDVSAHKFGSIQVAGTFSGSLTIQGSNDNSTFSTVQNTSLNSTTNAVANTITTTGLYSFPIAYRFLRIRMTAYTSGTATGTLELYTSAPAFMATQVGAGQVGTWTVGSNSATGSAVPANAFYGGINYGGNLVGIQSAGNVADGITGAGVPTAMNYLWNGTTYDRLRSSGPTGTAAVAGSFTEQASLTAGSLNADLVASTDVSAYRQWSLQIQGTFSGTLSFQGSNDNTNFVSVTAVTPSGQKATGATGSSGVIYGGPVQFRYLRVRMTAYTSGTATGTLELSTVSNLNWVQVSNDTGNLSINAPTGTGSAVPANAFYQGIKDGSGNLLGVSSAAAVADGTALSSTPGAGVYTYNGTTWDRMYSAAARGDGTSLGGSVSSGNFVYSGSNWDRMRSGGVMGMVGTTAQASPSGGYTPGKLISAASTNATVIKASAGTLGTIMVGSINAAARYLKIYDKASAPTVGTDTPVAVYIIPGNTAGAGSNIPLPPQGLAFTSGISLALTTGITDADTGAVAASEIVVSYGYK